MGRLIRLAAAAGAALAIGLVSAPHALGFDGFGEATADSTYEVEIQFDVDLRGAAPDRLELLMRTPEAEASFVVPVEPDGDHATYVWDTSVDYVTPNTLVTYQWRATDGDEVVLGSEETIRYEDDRPGLDWQHAQLGETTVHWYGDAEAQARRFGELTAVGVAQAEELLGTELAGPVDVFVYDSREDFFGALGPGAREWTGAAAYSELRTIFMWLGGGSPAYLEVAMVHEVTHIVFYDATNNPFHEPARWLNEGIATWSESGDAGEQRGIVEFEAGGGGSSRSRPSREQFPIGERERTAVVCPGHHHDRRHHRPIRPRGHRRASRPPTATARPTRRRSRRAPASLPTQLYAEFYAEFGVDAPAPIEPEPIAASNVDRPPAGEIDQGGVIEEPVEPPDVRSGRVAAR